jgi:hypothetical protein
MRATIISVDGAQSARVRDLTDTGVGIVSDSPLDQGTDVIFNRGNLLVAARVVWTRGTEAGLEFYRPVPLDELTGTVAPPATQPDHDRLFFRN